MKRYRFLYIITLVISLLFSLEARADDNQNSEPTIATANGIQTYCVYSAAPVIYVKIEVKPEYTKTIEKFVVEWYPIGGSGTLQSKEITTNLHNPPPFIIPFDLSDLLSECKPDKKFQVTLYTHTKEDLDPVNNGFVITFRKAPESRFILDTGSVCSEVPMVLDAAPSCPSNISTYDWEVKDTTGSVVIGTHSGVTYEFEFPAPGTYPVQLVTENVCGVDTLVQDVVVADNPFNDVKVSTDLKDDINDYCLNSAGEKIIDIDASKSKNASKFNFIVYGPPGGHKLINTKDEGHKKIEFKKSGHYTVILQIFLKCNYVYSDTFNVVIHDIEKITLPQPQTACLEYEFTPPSTNPVGTIYINDLDTMHTFPYKIGIGTHEITAQYTGICGLIQTKTKILVLDPASVVNPLTPQNLNMCLQDTSMIVSRTDTFSNYEPSPFLILNDSNEYVFTPTDTGLYTFTEYIGEGPCRRTVSTTISVTSVINPLTDLTFCYGDGIIPIPLDLTTGVLTIDSCTNCIVGKNFDFTNTPKRDFNISYTLANIYGCSITKQATLKVIEPKAEFEITGVPCIENINAFNNPDLADSFLWRVNLSSQNSNFDKLRDSIHVGLNTVMLYATTAMCTDSISKSFTIIPTPLDQSVFDLATPACSPYVVTPQIAAAQSSDFNYSWAVLFKDSTDFFNSYNLPNNYTLSVKPGETQEAQVLYKVENVCGVDSNLVSIQIMNKPIAVLGIASSREACDSLDATLINRSYGTIEKAVWHFDGITVDTTVPYLTHIFTAQDTTTRYPIHLTVSNQCGADSTQDTITIFYPRMDAFFSVSKNIVCPGDSVYFTDASTPIPTTIRWDFGDGTSSTIPNPVHAYDGTQKSYIVTLYAMRECGWDTTSKVILLKDFPLVAFEVPDIICSRDSSSKVISSSIQKNQNYTWYIGDSTPIRNITNPILSFPKGGEHKVTLVIQDLTSQCIMSLTKTLDIKEKPKAIFTIDSVNCFDDQLLVFNHSEDATSAKWFLDQEYITDVFAPALNFTSIGYKNLKLVAYNEDFCSDSTSKRFLVKRCGYFIPNAFTPNRDGIDDYFTIYSSSEVTKVLSLQIFNRWGQIVFEKQNFLPNIEHEGWDGNYQKKNNSYTLEPEVFIYQAKLLFDDGSEQIVTGDITLIR